MARSTNVLFEVWRLARRTGAVVDEAVGDTGLTASDYGLYSAIHIWGPTTPSVLARHSGMPLTTVSHALRRLERRGHLTRSVNPDDARSTTVVLSDAGRQVHAAASAAFERLIGRLNRVLGTETDPIWLSLRRLNQALAALSGEGGDPLANHDGELAHDSVRYHGEPLTNAEADEVRLFIDWLRNRRRATA